jgi:hypothetical protein
MIFLNGRELGHVSSMLSGLALIFALKQHRRRVDTPPAVSYHKQDAF